ncbi:MAG TPA: hypothetical protein VLQ45_15745 [Thermoanaerobaculia bacterium]|nr:hypothetical protein [Thermoanaerobaculia bacterium]
MSNSSVPERWWRIALLVILLAGAYWAAQAILDANLVDDSYIFLRYADNAAGGQGPVFNPGERVEGYTSPLWLAILAGAAALGADLPSASRLLGALLGLATLGLTFGAVRRLPHRRNDVAFLPAWFLATNPAFIYWTWSGMDTALFTLLFAATYFSFSEWLERGGNLTLTGLCFALATLARPDMLAALPVFLAFIASRSRQERTWHHLLTFGAPLLLPVLHVLWRLHYYGVPLPNTYYAKAAIPRAGLLLQGIKYCIHFLFAYQVHLWLMLWIAVLLLAPIARLNRAWKTGLCLLGVWISYVAWMGGDHFGMFRFFIPALPVLAFVVTRAALALPAGEKIQSREGAAALCAAALIVILALNFAIYEYHGGRRGRQEVALARSWGEVGRWLRRNVPEESTLAAVVVGAIPYYSHLETIDMLGLTDARVARQGKVLLAARVGHQKYDSSYVLARRPDYIVYPSSGLFDRPMHPDGKVTPGEFPYAFEDLLNDPRTWVLYEYQTFRMENGRFVELLHRRRGNS